MRLFSPLFFRFRFFHLQFLSLSFLRSLPLSLPPSLSQHSIDHVDQRLARLDIGLRLDDRRRLSTARATRGARRERRALDEHGRALLGALDLLPSGSEQELAGPQGAARAVHHGQNVPPRRGRVEAAALEAGRGKERHLGRRVFQRGGEGRVRGRERVGQGVQAQRLELLYQGLAAGALAAGDLVVFFLGAFFLCVERGGGKKVRESRSKGGREEVEKKKKNLSLSLSSHLAARSSFHLRDRLLHVTFVAVALGLDLRAGRAQLERGPAGTRADVAAGASLRRRGRRRS